MRLSRRLSQIASNRRVSSMVRSPEISKSPSAYSSHGTRCNSCICTTMASNSASVFMALPLRRKPRRQQGSGRRQGLGTLRPFVACVVDGGGDRVGGHGVGWVWTQPVDEEGGVSQGGVEP